MLTSTICKPDDASASPRGLALPPVGFYVPHRIWSAGRSAQPFDAPRASPTRTAAQKAGLRYQAAVERRLRKEHSNVEIGTWFRYVDDGHRPRWCQCDALLSGGAVIIEVKYRWMDTAWWQLQRLYRPVIEAALGVKPRCVAIVRSFDPAVVVPGKVKLLASIDEPLSSEETGVLLWRM